MKILFPIGIFYPASVGGPSNTVYWHTCYIKKNNIDTYIVTTDLEIDTHQNIKLNQWVNNEAGNVIYCKTRFNYFPLKAAWETIKKMMTVDVVHYSSAYYCLTIYTIFFSILMRRKVFLSPRGEFFPIAIDNPLKRFVIRLYKLVSRYIIFHATSDEEYQSIKDLYPEANIIIQPNFIDCKTSEKSFIKSKNIVFLGILYSVKKIENLIKAVSISECFKSSNSLLLIAGKPLVKRDYEYRDMLVSLIKSYNLEKKIKFVGEVFGEEKDKFLNDAYILVLPSETENFGNVVTEALSQSTPVIASRGTPWKILQERNVGWWIDNDPIMLKEAIDVALSLSEIDYMNKSKKSLQLVNEKFNIYLSSDNRWIALYQGCQRKGTTR